MRSSHSLALVLLLGSNMALADQSATLLLHNATIYTVNAEQPWASAMVPNALPIPSAMFSVTVRGTMPRMS